MTEQPASRPEPEHAHQDGHHDDLVEPAPELRPALEAVLMVTDQPLDHVTLAQAVAHPPQQVQRALHELAEEYRAEGRGFDLRHVGSGWRFYTREEFAPIVEKYVLDGQQARLTQAALETLAVVAYRQPVSRARVSAVRGVNVDGVMRTLLTRGLVEEAGQDGETGAVLYRTSGYFLERMGLESLDDLPPLAPLLPDIGDLDANLDAREEAVTSPAAGTGAGPETRAEMRDEIGADTRTEAGADARADTGFEDGADTGADARADTGPEDGAADGTSGQQRLDG